MVDLVEWLRAQLDEDERIARAAGGASWEELPVSGWVHTTPLPASEWQPPGYDHHVASAPLVEDRAHIVTHDPARVLREIDAKRQLLNDHPIVPRTIEPTVINGEEIGGPHFPFGCQNCHAVHDTSEVYGFGYCFTVKVLALPYADRPGYREEWRP
ncbi:hypothetical protein GCM10010294_25190 [Streptomyces griseoloalbus]|uniref:DUF6221 family protein n=1 Tax=Streptomyces griseoloalbus TaxID=67303 RepID=UPI001873BA1F|nr:hypothetical protein GCM10010294_25190 [Streptomyces griseoloalbus]